MEKGTYGTRARSEGYHDTKARAELYHAAKTNYGAKECSVRGAELTHAANMSIQYMPKVHEAPELGMLLERRIVRHCGT